MNEPASLSDTRTLLAGEKKRFDDAYRDHFLAGETRGPEIGSPVFLEHPGAENAVLLIHGFMAAPDEVRPWAADLFSHGYTVYAPRLAGHGTSAVDLAACDHADWVASVNRGYEILAGSARRIVVAGFSTGAGLALHQAITYPERYAAVISVSAPMKFSGLGSTFSEAMEVWNRLMGMLNLDGLRKEFARNHPDNPEINYHRCPIHGFNQVKALMRQVNRGLPGMSVPSLIVQGNRDPKVNPRSGRLIFDRIGDGAVKDYVEIDHDCHGIVRGAVGTRVFTAARTFLMNQMRHHA